MALSIQQIQFVRQLEDAGCRVQAERRRSPISEFALKSRFTHLGLINYEKIIE
jgi:hypothetical protein